MRTVPTEREKEWWRRLRRVMEDMPSTMEVHATACGELRAGESGSMEDAYARTGNADSAKTLTLPTITGRIRDAGGAL